MKFCLNIMCCHTNWVQHQPTIYVCQFIYVNSSTIDQKSCIQSYFGYFSIFLLNIFRITAIVHCTHDYQWRFLDKPAKKFGGQTLRFVHKMTDFSCLHIFDDQRRKIWSHSCYMENTLVGSP